MHSVSLSMQPTGMGELISWVDLHRGRVKPAGRGERIFGLTVSLTDAVSGVLTVCRSIDPGCETSVVWKRRLLFPEFCLAVGSRRFNATVEKRLAGGAHEENTFNYRVTVELSSPTDGIVQMFLNGVRTLCPKPLEVRVDRAA